MNIAINSAKLEELIQGATYEAIEGSIKDYEVQKALRSQLASTLLSTNMAQVVDKALEQVNIAKLTEVMAKTLTDVLLRGTVHMLHLGIARLLTDIENVDPYRSRESKEASLRKHLDDLKAATGQGPGAKAAQGEEGDE